MPDLTRSKLHGRMIQFVDWIRPPDATEDAIRKQAEDIRSRIRDRANADGLVVQSTPSSGSFAKRTGLRRHLQGLHSVEGQDVDLPFVVSPKTRDGEALDSLLDKFYRYAHAIYPNTSKDTTRSSVKLDFAGTKLRYDIVPMLSTHDPNRQIILRSDGTRRETSITGHVEFIRQRTRTSNELPGRVKFNECVRLMKWWRTIQTGGDEARFPSIVVDLISAYAYDHTSVQMTYAETLAQWFGVLARAVKLRTPIHFEPAPMHHRDAWVVIDPMNAANNVVSTWRNVQLEELQGWLEEARDALTTALAADQRSDDAAVVSALVKVFGNPFRNHTSS